VSPWWIILSNENPLEFVGLSMMDSVVKQDECSWPIATPTRRLTCRCLTVQCSNFIIANWYLFAIAPSRLCRAL